MVHEIKNWLCLILGIVLFVSCTKEITLNPTPAVIDPGKAPARSVLTLTGSDLKDVQKITFDLGNVNADFNPTFNTNEAIIFRVPDEANPGHQNIIFTTKSGYRFSVPFEVLAVPTLTATSVNQWSAGQEITISGNYLSTANRAYLANGGQELEIVSNTQTELVVRFPASEIISSKVVVVNEAGASTTEWDYYNIDQAFQIFTDDYYPGFGDGSWGDPGTISTDVKISGNASVFKNYQKGNWHLIQFVDWNNGITYDPVYKKVTVWIKGASKDYRLFLTTDTRDAGFGNGDQTTPLDVPANVWSYFELPISDLGNKFINGEAPLKQIGFWIMGPDAQDEIFYFDNLLLVK